MATDAIRTQLIGRDRELALTDELLDDLARGQGAALFLFGEPGIGKTSLINEALERANERGFKALSGRASEFERDVPFGVLTDALEGELDLLVEGMDDRHGLLRVLREYIDGRADGPRLVLALDDLHWADAASIDIICQILHRPLATPVLILLAARPQLQLPRLLAALEEAERRGHGHRQELTPLSASESFELLGGDVDRAAGERLFAESGGNPFYLQQLATAEHHGSDVAVIEARDGDPVPQAVIVSILGELEALGEPARLLARGAAVAGEPFSLELAGEIAGIDGDAALEALDQLLGRELIRSTGTPRSFRFRHPIVRRALYESAGEGERLAAHSRAAAALADRGASASSRAHHVERSAAVGDEQGIAVLVEAGHQCMYRAPASAAHWFDAALRLMGDATQHESMRLELLTHRAAALGVAGHIEEARDALRELLKLLPPELTPIRRRAVTVSEVLEDLLGNHDACERMLLRELANVDDVGSSASMEVSTSLSINRFFKNDWNGMAHWARRALQAESSGDGARVAALSTLALGEYGLGELERAEQATNEGAALFDQISDAYLADHNPGAAVWLGWAESCLERFDDSIGHLDRAVRVARSTGQRHLVPAMLLFQFQPLMTRGDLERASENAESVMEQALLMASDMYRNLAMVMRAGVALVKGDVYAALRFAEQGARDATGDDTTSSIARSVLAEALLEAGEVDRFREVLVPGGVPRLPVFPMHAARCHVMLLRAELARNSIDAADTWAAGVEELARRYPQASIKGLATEARGMVLFAQGDYTAAAQQALKAVEYAQRLGSPVATSYARMLAGEALAAAGERADAVELLEEALADLRQFGRPRYEDRAASALRRLGRAVPRRGDGAGPGRLSGLSGREAEVLRLVAQGKTNRDIAADLFLSVRTVDRHMSRIFEKLGVSSRAAAVSTFERLRPSS